MGGDDQRDMNLERQRAAAEEDFREGEYQHALKVISDGRLTGMDPALIRAVRNGAQPGNPLPPPERKPFITGVADDAEVIISGNDADRCVAVLFSHQHFPGIRFGYRLPPPSVVEIRHSTIWLKEEIETGALHRMMQDQPPADEAGIVWTTW